jgi:hypothetical protein
MKRRGSRLSGPGCILASLAGALLATAPAASTRPVAPSTRAAQSPAAQPTAPPAPQPPPSLEAIHAAAARAGALLASDRWSDPFALILSDTLYRRFAVEALSTSARRFAEFRAAHPEVAWVDVFRRLIDPGQKARREWLDAAPGGVRGLDRLTVLALYCDQVPPPADYPALLEKGRAEGGYALTHVALALIWLRENDCRIVEPDFEKRVIRETAALVRVDATVSDLELEAAAMVARLGEARILPDGFLEEVIAAQHPDGGWAEDSGKAGLADWHPTFLALWLLLESEHPGVTIPMVPRPAGGAAAR